MSEEMDAVDVSDGSGDGESGSSPIAGAVPNEARTISRRDALRKAATGAVLGGAIWAAPRVEGLSLLPDYAEAGTVSGVTVNLVLDAADGNNLTQTGCSNDSDALLYFPVAANSSWAPNTAASAANAPFTRTAPLGAAGNVVFTATAPFNMDGDKAINGQMNFTFNIDPPFNKCRVSSAVGRDCTFIDGVDPFNLPTNNNPAPGATNPAPFTVGVNLPSQGGPDNAGFNFVITCT